MPIAIGVIKKMMKVGQKWSTLFFLVVFTADKKPAIKTLSVSSHGDHKWLFILPVT